MRRRKPKLCEKCGLELGFRRRAGSGKWEPCNPDGSDHWDTCRQERNRRIHAAGGKEEIDEEIVETAAGPQVKKTAVLRGGGDQLTRRSWGIKITGKNYNAAEAEAAELAANGRPPWE